LFNKLPTISIIIVTHNGKLFLDECLESLKNLEYPKEKLEIIIVDNASTDGTIEYLSSNFPDILLIKFDKNYGFCKPNNEGAKKAKGEYLVFLNNDTVVTPKWLSELIKGVLDNDRVISCASKMLYYDQKDTINTAGGKITIIGGGFYNGYGDKDSPKYNAEYYTGFGCGAGVLVKRDFFLDIGGFDEDYFASCEEHDLGWKCWLYGYKVLFMPEAVMYHKESGTYGTKSSFQPIKVYLITRNRLYNLIKNFELKNIIKGIIISIAFDIYRISTYIFQMNFKSIYSIIKAYIDFLRNINLFIKKRKLVQMKRVIPDEQLYMLGVIATFKECITEEKRLRKIWKDQFYDLNK